MLTFIPKKKDERLLFLSTSRILDWMDLTWLFLYRDKFKEPRNTQKKLELPTIPLIPHFLFSRVWHVIVSC